MTITKNEKTGTYSCRFQINGERKRFKCVGATTKAEAIKLENQFKYKLQQQQNGVIPAEKKKIKLQVLLDLYDKHGKINKLSYGRDAFGKYIGLYFGVDSYADNIKTQDVEDFKVWLKNKRNSSPSTINKYIFALSKMFNLAISNKLLIENPIDDVVRLREENTKVRFLLREEETRLFKAIDKHCPHIKNIVICALQTGMRRGEIFNLKWENIDFDFGFIEVLKSKSGKSRKIPISDTLRKTLDEIPKTSEYVFVNTETGKPFTDIKNSFHTALKKAEIENFRFHDIRHTVATRLIEAGVHLPVVQEILGHARIQTTMRYNHVVARQKIEAISVLNSYN